MFCHFTHKILMQYKKHCTVFKKPSRQNTKTNIIFYQKGSVVVKALRYKPLGQGIDSKR